MSNFTKANLEVGDFLIQRDGMKMIFLGHDKGMCCNYGGWKDVACISDNLTCSTGRDFDIVQVYRPSKKHQCCFNHYSEGELVFDAYASREMTLFEIEKELGYKIEIVRNH